MKKYFMVAIVSIAMLLFSNFIYSQVCIGIDSEICITIKKTFRLEGPLVVISTPPIDPGPYLKSFIKYAKDNIVEIVNKEKLFFLQVKDKKNGNIRFNEALIMEGNKYKIKSRTYDSKDAFEKYWLKQTKESTYNVSMEIFKNVVFVFSKSSKKD